MKMNAYCLTLLLALYLRVTESRFCALSNQTAKEVNSCPVTEEELIKRREKKKCDLFSERQNCTEASNFHYHCVMNEFEDAFVEVCAPAYMINGFCAEYNTIGGRIQLHFDKKCSDVTPPCANRYLSTDAYLYKGCYDVIERNLRARSSVKSTESIYTSGAGLNGSGILDSHWNTTKNIRNGLGTGVIVAIVAVIIVILLSGITFLYVKKSGTKCSCKKKKDNLAEEESIPLQPTQRPNTEPKDSESDPSKSNQTSNTETKDSDNPVPLGTPEIDSNTCTTKSMMNQDKKTPGKPYVLGISSNSVQLKWDKSVENPKNYRIHSVNFNKWYCTDSNEIHIPDLVKKTQYKFQVHGDFEDGLGPSSLQSEDIEIPDCIKDSHGFWKPSGTGYPFKYMVPLNEKIERTAKMRTMTIGEKNNIQSPGNEKTIMLVGATGSGVTDLVDGIVNYAMRVNYRDSYRFTVTWKPEKKGSHTFTQPGKGITVYEIHPEEGGRVSFTLKIIVMTGIDDPQKNGHLQNAIENLSMLGDLRIHAICFVVKAPDEQFTIIEEYTYRFNMSLFGKDLESNICMIINSTKESKPSADNSTQGLGLPFEKTFYSSALFAPNSDQTNDLSFFWEMNSKMFELFFEHIIYLKKQRLGQTRYVLDKAKQLRSYMDDIAKKVNDGLKLKSYLSSHSQVYEDVIEKNKCYLKKEAWNENKCKTEGIYCHKCKRYVMGKQDLLENMAVASYCTACPRCRSYEHLFLYSINLETKTVEITDIQMKKKYQCAEKQKKELELKKKKLRNIAHSVKRDREQVELCQNELTEKAFIPDPLPEAKQIELMICSEREKKTQGHIQRLVTLKGMKNQKMILDGQLVKEILTT